MKKLIIAITILIINNDYGYAQTPESDDSSHEKWEYALESTGDVIQFALPLSAGIMTLIEKDYEGTKKLAFSYATTIAITYALKKIVHKQRPEGRELFDSFPSGHTASAFSGASFIQRRYGWKYGKYAYVLATIVAISRTESPDGWHDFWDVFGGAAVGIGSTYLFTKPYKKQKIDLGFAKYGNTFLLSFKYEF